MPSCSPTASSGSARGSGCPKGAVGSVLAAVGTALPETLLPLVAIVTGHVSGEEIGIGAILGAPFMLTTLAMLVVGVAVLFSRAADGGAPTSTATPVSFGRTSATSS